MPANNSPSRKNQRRLTALTNMKRDAESLRAAVRNERNPEHKAHMAMGLARIESHMLQTALKLQQSGGQAFDLEVDRRERMTAGGSTTDSDPRPAFWRSG